jgi:hypothetical protein
MIEKTNDLHLFFSDPCLVLGQNITVHPFENVRLTFNANVFYGMVNAVSDYTRQERGALYKFDILNNGPTLFLPESMMRFLHDYDWNQHMLQVNEWLARREEKLRTLETTGTFKRIRRLEVVLN